MTDERRKPPRGQEELLNAILDLSSTDRQFRSDLLRDPANAIHARFGVAIPRSYRLRFIEKDPEVDSLVVLPEFRSADEELDEDDLEAVSGGSGEGDPYGWK